jgi:hypothetical protein
MDDSGTDLATHAAQVRHVKQKGVDERLIGVTGRRMNHEAGRFVDDGQIVVLIENG